MRWMIYRTKDHWSNTELQEIPETCENGRFYTTDV